MKGDSNPLVDEFDVSERDYEVTSKEQAKRIARKLVDRYEDFDDYIHGHHPDGELAGWRRDAMFSIRLAPYFHGEWEYIVPILTSARSNFKIVEGANSSGGSVGDYEKKVKAAFEKYYLGRSWETHPYEDRDGDPVEVDSPLFSWEEIEEDVEMYDVKEQIRMRVLRPWHPRDHGLDPDEDDINVIDEREAIHRTATIFDEAWEYLFPESDVRGWELELYVYDEKRGIYRPRGENHIETQSEALLGEYSTNNIVNELVSKLKRRNRVDYWDMKNSKPHPHRLVVGNGILDLRTGERDSYSADEYHRTRIDVDYHEDAECPEIDDFLHDIVADEDVPTLYRVTAHTLAKEYIDEKAMMLVGDGNNGKSAFINLLEAFLGDRNVASRSLQDLSSDDWAPADLHETLANVSGDMSEQEADDLSTFKQLTGGDSLTGDIKFEQPVKFTNYASLIFASNGVPDLPDDDMAVWQRWVYINFPNRFGEDGNKQAVSMRVLMDRIAADEELEGLLARCVDEYKAYHDGRDFFPSVGDAHEVRNRMKKAAEPVYRFAEEMLVEVDPAEHDEKGNYQEWTARVRQAYREYAREEGLPIIDQAQFGDRLQNLRDYSVTRRESRPVGPDTRNYVYEGLQLSEEAEALLGNDSDEDDGQNGKIDDEYDEDGSDYQFSGGREESIRVLARETDREVKGIVKALALSDDAVEATRDIVRDERGIGDEMARTGGDDGE